mmetsp:Transcript_4613/g.7745  ORF Transcript_4613/g.7745 Transcript_4613/m.7745 type:complete len:322 (-) Transcript_4613:297-1262(-)
MHNKSKRKRPQKRSTPLYLQALREDSCQSVNKHIRNISIEELLGRGEMVDTRADQPCEEVESEKDWVSLAKQGLVNLPVLRNVTCARSEVRSVPTNSDALENAFRGSAYLEKSSSLPEKSSENLENIDPQHDRPRSPGGFFGMVFASCQTLSSQQQRVKAPSVLNIPNVQLKDLERPLKLGEPIAPRKRGFQMNIPPVKTSKKRRTDKPKEEKEDVVVQRKAGKSWGHKQLQEAIKASAAPLADSHSPSVESPAKKSQLTKARLVKKEARWKSGEDGVDEEEEEEDPVVQVVFDNNLVNGDVDVKIDFPHTIVCNNKSQVA